MKSKIIQCTRHCSPHDHLSLVNPRLTRSKCTRLTNTSWQRNGEKTVGAARQKFSFFFWIAVGVFQKVLFMHPKFAAFSGAKEINVFNLKLTRRFTLLIFCFRAAELLFSISSPYTGDICISCKRRCGSGLRTDVSSAGRGILLWFRTRPHNREKVLFMNPPLNPHYVYIYISFFFLFTWFDEYCLWKRLLTISNPIDFGAKRSFTDRIYSLLYNSLLKSLKFDFSFKCYMVFWNISSY